MTKINIFPYLDVGVTGQINKYVCISILLQCQKHKFIDDLFTIHKAINKEGVPQIRSRISINFLKMV